MARQQRRRRRKPSADLAGPRKTRLPFPINLIFNVKAFYVFFIVVMIASMAAVGLGVGDVRNPSRPNHRPDRRAVVTPNVVSFDSARQGHRRLGGYEATLTTSEGDIVIEFATDAPGAVNNFAFLAAKNFYDDTAFFYVDHDYVAQGGDPNCTPKSDTTRRPRPSGEPTNAPSVERSKTCTGFGDPGYSLPLEDGEATQTSGPSRMPASAREPCRG